MLSYSMTLIPHGDWLASMVGWRSRDWQMLQHLHSRHSIPWLYLGGFNEILTSKEKQGGQQKTLESHVGISGLLTTLWFGGLGFSREYVYVEQWCERPRPKKVSLKKDIRVPFKEPLFLGKWYGVASYFFYTKNKKN